MVHFSAEEFTRGNEKNTTMVLIPQSRKFTLCKTIINYRVANYVHYEPCVYLGLCTWLIKYNRIASVIINDRLMRKATMWNLCTIQSENSKAAYRGRILTLTHNQFAVTLMGLNQPCVFFFSFLFSPCQSVYFCVPMLKLFFYKINVLK